MDMADTALRLVQYLDIALVRVIAVSAQMGTNRPRPGLGFAQAVSVTEPIVL